MIANALDYYALFTRRLFVHRPWGYFMLLVYVPLCILHLFGLREAYFTRGRHSGLMALFPWRAMASALVGFSCDKDGALQLRERGVSVISVDPPPPGMSCWTSTLVNWYMANFTLISTLIIEFLKKCSKKILIVRLEIFNVERKRKLKPWKILEAIIICRG